MERDRPESEKALALSAWVAKYKTGRQSYYGMTHTLPPLPYAYDALEPHIDEATMRVHHTKHHQTYVDKLNAAVGKYPQLDGISAEELVTDLLAVPEDIRTAVRNHGGGHANHTLFWATMAPNAGGAPTGELASAIDETFGSFAEFKTRFTDAALNRFGSGWAWLVVTDGRLAIISTPNQDSPLTENKTPILGLDMWEHAMYLRFQNRKPDYIAAWWNVVDWTAVYARYSAAKE